MAALIGGHAPAGGTLLTNCCDFRVMLNNPKFSIGLNEVRVETTEKVKCLLTAHEVELLKDPTVGRKRRNCPTCTLFNMYLGHTEYK